MAAADTRGDSAAGGSTQRGLEGKVDHQSRWEIVGNGLVLVSLAGYAISLTARVVAGDLTTAESSVITQLLVVVGLALGFGFQQVGLWQARREAREQRKQDRIDREQQREQDKMDQEARARELARYVQLQADAVALKAQLSHAETLAHISDVKATTTVALEAANHSNEKIAKLAEHIDSSLQIVPAVAAAVADALKPAPAVPTLERTPGTVLTETVAPPDTQAERKE